MTRGSGGRNRPGERPLPRLAKEAHLLGRPLRATENATDERVDREGEHEVEQHARQERTDESGARVDGVAEHDVQRQGGDGVQDRHHGDREQRRVRAVATRRLAVAADPVTGHGEQQRRLTEPREVRSVQEEPGREPRGGAPDRTAQERDRDERDEQEVGRAACDLDRADDRRLQHDGDEDEHRGLEDVGAHRTSTVTVRRFERSTYETIWICLNGSVSLCDTLVTVPIGIPRGNSDGSRGTLDPAVAIRSARATSLSFVTFAKASEPPSPDCTSPIALVRIEYAATALDSSVSSVTTAVSGDSSVISPTSAPADSTGAWSRMPSLEPAAIRSCLPNCDCSPSTRVCTERYASSPGRSL